MTKPPLAPIPALPATEAAIRACVDRLLLTPLPLFPVLDFESIGAEMHFARVERLIEIHRRRRLTATGT